MLRKDDLRKLRKLRATPAMISAAKENDSRFEEQVKNSWGREYTRVYSRKYAYFLRCQNLGGYLKVAVFFSEEINKGELDPHYEVFINPETGEYITRILKDGNEVGWNGSMIGNLKIPCGGCNSSYWWASKWKTWINPEGGSNIRSVLKVRDGGVDGIEDFQIRVRKERRDKGYEENVKRWEAECAPPELTEHMSCWLEHEVVQKHFIFYKYDRSGVKEGYCTYCEDMVPVPEKYKNNLKSMCPVCRKQVELKSIGNRKRLSTEAHRGTVLQEQENGNLIIRIFNVRNHMKYPFDSVTHEVKEYCRFVFDGARVRSYRFEMYKNYAVCWNGQQTGYYRGYADNGCIYKRNLHTLESGVLRYSGLLTMIRKKQLKDYGAQEWLAHETGNPLLEQLVKMDMCGLAYEVAKMRYDKDLLNESATGATEMLKLDRARLKRLRASGKKATVIHLRWLQYEKRMNTQYSDEMIIFFAENDLLPDSFRFLPVKLGYDEIKNYLAKQSDMSKDSIKQTLGTWRDYIGMAEKLKLQITVEQIYKPSNLMQKHAHLVDILKSEDMEKQAAKLEEKWPAVNGELECLKKYQYTDGEYLILPPGKVYDIVREGTLLSHCIHTVDYYWDRISRRESFIFFLRKAQSPDAPWYTLEVEPDGSIRQKRTTGDNQNPDLKKAESFLRKWQKELKKVLSEEDRKLALKSKDLRKQGYKKLREKNERIRSGKLAGQLLADVLEADYMEA